MKSFGKILIAGLLAGGLSAPVFAQVSDTATGNASVAIISPIDITAGTALNFGAIVPPSTGTNTITINEDTGVISVTGAGNGGRVNSSTTSRASFGVTGEAGYVANFTIVDNTVDLDGPGDDIPLTLTLSDASLTLTGGAATVYVGGNFNIASGQTAGAYSTTFQVTASYN